MDKTTNFLKTDKYHLKKLIPGYKIKPSLKGKTLVALPFAVKNPTVVVYKSENYYLRPDSPLLHKETFEDKFGRDKSYTLYYYEYVDKKNDNQLKMF